MAGCANQEPLVSETSGSGTAKTLADAWNARRVVRSGHRKIYVGFSSATTVLSWVINGHFARLSSFGPKKRRKALWKRSRPRPGEGGLRSSEKISIDSKGSRFREGSAEPRCSAERGTENTRTGGELFTRLDGGESRGRQRGVLLGVRCGRARVEAREVPRRGRTDAAAHGVRRGCVILRSASPRFLRSETRDPRSPSAAPPPSAGKLDLVEFFLGTDAGRGLVNVSDEVRVSPDFRVARRRSRRPKTSAITTTSTEVPTYFLRK